MTKQETNNIENMTRKQLIHNFHYYLHKKLKQSKPQEKIFISKYIDIPKQITTNHEFKKEKDKSQYLKEYLIKNYYFKTYPSSIEILEYYFEKVEYGLYDILYINYTISEKDYLSNLEKIIDDYIPD